MKPKNKTEHEVCSLSKRLPRLSPKQRSWAIEKCSSEENAYIRSSRVSYGSFYLVTTCKGWQVLRYFQVKVKYRFHKRTERVVFEECMQQWLKDGKYVFLAKQRTPGFVTDRFCQYGELQVRNHTRYGFLGDPRQLGYDDVYYSRLQDKYRYIIRDFKEKVSVDVLMRAVNVSSYCETLLRNNPSLWDLCEYRGVLFDKEKMMAVKVANRHHYEHIDPEWFDMVDSLAYLKKDLRNPVIICPKDVHQAHDYWVQRAYAMRRKNSDRMAELCKLAMEKKELREIQEREERAKRQMKEAKDMNRGYVTRMRKYLGIDITDGTIHIKPLQTIEDFYEEGKEMHHCVFSNKYYDNNSHPNCLILSATINSQRIETIEVNLLDGKVVQSRGKYNQPSTYHDRIISLIQSKRRGLVGCNFN